MWENGKDVVELQETTGYNPIFEYAEYSPWNIFDEDDYGRRCMTDSDVLQ